MTAQSKLPAKQKRRLSANDKSHAIELRLNSGLTYQEIGKILNTSKQTIHRNLAKLIPDKTTEVYKEHRADILSHAQLRILSNVTESKLKKSSARDLIVSAGILYDKERIERGGSTEAKPLIIVNRINISNATPIQGIEQKTQVIDITQDDDSK